MVELKDFFLKFKNVLLGEEIKKETIRSIISEVAGVSIKKEEIEIKNGTIYLDIKPVYKSEIFLKKEKILSRLEEALTKRSPKDLR